MSLSPAEREKLRKMAKEWRKDSRLTRIRKGIDKEYSLAVESFLDAHPEEPNAELEQLLKAVDETSLTGAVKNEIHFLAKKIISQRLPSPFPRDAEIEALRNLPDEQIDTSDIPKITDWKTAVKGRFAKKAWKPPIPTDAERGEKPTWEQLVGMVTTIPEQVRGMYFTHEQILLAAKLRAGKE